MDKEKECQKYIRDMNRIKGQLDGVLDMIKSERDPVEIVNQIKAVRSGLANLAVSILNDEASKCFDKRNKKLEIKDIEALVKSFFSVE
jgi:DNA-binding FrmR family transcriptional regulator